MVYACLAMLPRLYWFESRHTLRTIENYHNRRDEIVFQKAYQKKLNIFPNIVWYKRPLKTSSFPMKLKQRWWKWVDCTIFTPPKIMGKCSKLHFFSSKTSIKCAIIPFTKCVSYYLKLVNLFGKRHSVSEQLFKWLPKGPFSLTTPQLHEDLDQTRNHIQTTPRIPPFRQGVICHIWPSQFGVHREQTQGVKLGISKIANYNNSS